MYPLIADVDKFVPGKRTQTSKQVQIICSNEMTQKTLDMTWIRKEVLHCKEFPKATKITSLDTLRLENNMFQEIAWYLFEIKKYKESLAYMKRGAQIYPNDLHMLINLANIYLFNNDYDKYFINEKLKDA